MGEDGNDEEPSTRETAEETTNPPSAGQHQPSARDLRVSDAEREHVVSVLQKAIGRGMLDLDEFTTRTDTAFAARTRGELNIVLADLPGLMHRDAVASQHSAGEPYSATFPAAETASGDRLELRGKGSTLTRKGRWTVPAEMLVHNKYGSTKLDFTEAEVTSPVVRIELDTKWGSIEIIIPQHAAVDVNSITEIKWGSLEDKSNSNGKAGTPRYVLTGRVHGGSLTIKNPRRGLFG